MTHQTCLSLTCLLLFTSVHASANDLILPITIDPNPSFFFEPPRGITPARSGYELIGTATPFTADPSEFDRIIWEIMAPVGQRYAVDPPAPASFVMSYELEGDPSGGPRQDPQPNIELEFSGLTGDAPTFSAVGGSFKTNGSELEVIWLGNVSAPFGFEGVRLIANGPFDSTQAWTFDTDFNNPFLKIRVAGLSSGPFFTLVPEPSALALLGLGGLLLVRHRRRPIRNT